MGFLSGKQSNRCKRINPLFQLLCKTYTESLYNVKILLDRLSEDVIPDDRIELVENDKVAHEYITRYENDKERTKKGEYRATAQFWILYTDLIQDKACGDCKYYF